MTNRTITIQVSKTVQTKQYEPVTVSVTETVVCAEDEAAEVRKDLYKDVTRAVHSYVDNETRKYQAKKASADDE